MGAAAVELLRWRCANPTAPARRVEIATRLVEQRSVRSITDDRDPRTADDGLRAGDRGAGGRRPGDVGP